MPLLPKIAVALITLAQGPRPIPIHNYVPSHLPSFLIQSKAKDVRAETSSRRGYRDISFEWEVKLKQDEVVKKLEVGYKADGLGYSDTGGRWLEMCLADRSILIHTQPGRSVPTGQKIDGKEVVRYTDRDKYTTILLFERALLNGPKPKNWPKQAMVPTDL